MEISSCEAARIRDSFGKITAIRKFACTLVDVVIRASTDELLAAHCRRFDLSNVLDGQPLQFMMRERGHRDRPLFAFEVWHEKLLQAALQAA